MKARGRWALGPHECQLRGVRGQLPQGRGPLAITGTPPGVVCWSCKELNWARGAGRVLSCETPMPGSRLVHHFPQPRFPTLRDARQRLTFPPPPTADFCWWTLPSGCDWASPRTGHGFPQLLSSYQAEWLRMARPSEYSRQRRLCLSRCSCWQVAEKSNFDLNCRVEFIGSDHQCEF